MSFRTDGSLAAARKALSHLRIEKPAAVESAAASLSLEYDGARPRAARAPGGPRGGSLLCIQPPMPHPAHPREPGPGRSHWRRSHWARQRRSPPVEPCRRRSRIRSAGAGHVFEPILQHVEQRPTDFARRAQSPRVIPISPHGSPAAEKAIDRLRQADRQPLASAGESRSLPRLDEEMHVIDLNAVVQDAEGPPGGGRKGVAHYREHGRAAQRRDTGGGAQRDVHGHSRLVRRPTTVRDGTAARTRRATGPATAAAPRAEDEDALRSVRHLESGR